MKRLFTILGAMVFMAGSAACAQEVSSNVPPQTAVTEVVASSSTDTVTTDDDVDLIPSISLDSRFGYEHTFSGKAAGFGGDGFYLNIDGSISKNFSYSLSQRLFSSSGEDDSVFDYTDWLTLTYDVGQFSFTAGKDVVKVGSFEYDAYDIDSYFDMNSMFYNSFSCYQWGISATWNGKDDDRSISFQVTNSPFSYSPKWDNMYAYNLAFTRSWEHYEALWSINFFEYERGEFVKCVALGNMFYFGDFSLNIDWITRADDWKDALDTDMTLNIAPSYNFGESVRLFGKFGWERTTDDLRYDFWGEYLSKEDKLLANEENEAVMPAFITSDKDYLFYGAGLEYFPLKENKSIRLHAIWASNNYTKRHVLNVGLTWKFDLVNAFRYIARKATR